MRHSGRAGAGTASLAKVVHQPRNRRVTERTCNPGESQAARISGATMTRDRSLVQAVELWLPQGELMTFGAGSYRGNAELARARARDSFSYGEGLAGVAWTSGKVLLRKEPASLPEGAELLALAGVDASLWWPLFDGGRLVAVVSLLLSNRSEAPSCVEVWDALDELDVLRHGGGYYVHCAELERFSPLIQFPRGTGLPGLTWLSGDAQVMADVRQSNAFIRAGLAARSGLKHGVGVPIYRDRKVVQVLGLFGAEQSSFIGGAEIYHPRGGELGAATLFDWSGRGSASVGESIADAPGRQLAERVLLSRSPTLVEAKRSGGHEISLALPLHDRKGLKQMLVLRLP